MINTKSFQSKPRVVAVRYGITKGTPMSRDTGEEPCVSSEEARAIIAKENEFISGFGYYVNWAMLVYDDGTTENLR